MPGECREGNLFTESGGSGRETTRSGNRTIRQGMTLSTIHGLSVIPASTPDLGPLPTTPIPGIYPASTKLVNGSGNLTMNNSSISVPAIALTAPARV